MNDSSLLNFITKPLEQESNEDEDDFKSFYLIQSMRGFESKVKNNSLMSDLDSLKDDLKKKKNQKIKSKDRSESFNMEPLH